MLLYVIWDVWFFIRRRVFFEDCRDVERTPYKRLPLRFCWCWLRHGLALFCLTGNTLGDLLAWLTHACLCNKKNRYARISWAAQYHSLILDFLKGCVAWLPPVVICWKKETFGTLSICCPSARSWMLRLRTILRGLLLWDGLGLVDLTASRRLLPNTCLRNLKLPTCQPEESSCLVFERLERNPWKPSPKRNRLAWFRTVFV